MRLWRICRRRYAAPDGEGAYLFGGRWNSRGVRVVYAATSLSLAAMEAFVALEPKLQPNDFVSIEGEIPEAPKIERLDLGSLPRNWQKIRDESLRRFGDDWIKTGKSVALLVPSAAVPGEWNLLLNPAHADFPKVKFREPQPFEFDVRMFR